MRKEMYSANDCGAFGKTFERDLKVLFGQADKVASPGKTDLRRRYKNIECKTNSGELGELGGKLIKGSSLVAYVPVVNMELPVEKQEGFLIDRVVFLETLDELGLIRTKKSTSGKLKTTIQTVWNYKQNKPHSLKKYNALLDALYERCEMTLEEWVRL
jgi:hypothetical protein